MTIVNKMQICIGSKFWSRFLHEDVETLDTIIPIRQVQVPR
jgi:hypothetical protein